MEAWVPFFQSLIWPIFIGLFLFFSRNWLQELLGVIKRRIESGSEMSIGPSGFALGAAPKLEESETSPTEESMQQAIEKYAERTKEESPSHQSALELARYFYLVHSATYSQEWSKRKGRPYYEIKVWLESDKPELINQVSKVVYHLHPTFPKPVREINTPDNNFELTTYAWGQFNLSADIYFNNGDMPLKLFRYLNF